MKYLLTTAAAIAFATIARADDDSGVCVIQK